MTDAYFTDSVPSESSQKSFISSPREAAITHIRNSLRDGQKDMADWRYGPLAVSAVPGAGKSTGMAAAAAIAIARQYEKAANSSRKSRQQLIVVTFTRSAAVNIKAKIRKYLKDLSLPPTGFVVNTLHGLALNIASRHPSLSGLELENVTLITPNQSHRVIRDCVEQWIAAHPKRYARLLEGNQFDGEETERLRRQSVLRTEVLPSLAMTVIHEAKSSGLTPQKLREYSQQTTDAYSILTVAAGLYDSYQNIMSDRLLIDYDDMILAALRVLENNSARKIEQNQVFAVFEDEAQDSSPLQTKLLEILATDTETKLENDLQIFSNHSIKSTVNLVRVGDPNQAINSTFTPADPIYFREFCGECDKQERLATMNLAGRSTGIVIQAANFALQWVNSQWSTISTQSSINQDQTNQNQTNQNQLKPFREQIIYQVDFDDPQDNANPPPIGKGLELCTPRDIHQTLTLISERISQLFTANKDNSAAILVRENRQGKWLAEALAPICQQNNIRLFDAGESDRQSHVPEEILAILQFCDRPHSPDYLKAALSVMVQRRLIETQDLNALASLPEDFLYPTLLAPPQQELVLKARQICRSLLQARMELPLYQIIPFIALTLNYNQSELATADKLAERINQQITGQISMGAIINTTSEIVSSERFEPIDTEDSEARYTRGGQLTIITMHKAKGLDWDCVFIPFLHENLIPGKFWIPPQSKFLGEFTLSEIARAQIRDALHGASKIPEVHQAWEQSKKLKIAEEYRLLYVAMTRAKKLLWMSAAKQAPFTWSKPNNLQDQLPCPLFPALLKQFPQHIIKLALLN
jgi:DNA helicase-2/ATP-dependent DNA helicase PcrA